MSPKSQLVIKHGREKSLRRRHPWIFSGAIERAEGEPRAGQVVDVVDAHGNFLARAGFSPQSQIRARVWTFDPEEAVDPDFFRDRLARAVHMRRRLGMLGADTACRLVFSEADELPGIVVDHYAGHLVLQLLSAGAEPWRDQVVAALVELLSPRGIYERSAGAARRKEGLSSRCECIFGTSPPRTLEYRSGPLRLIADLEHGQKTGAYLDQQLNRRRVAVYAPGRRVLDAFAHTGGFALGALLGGAEQATLVDSSSEALRTAAEGAALNGVEDRCRTVCADVFEELRVLRARDAKFDLIVVDPPKFVHSAQQIRAGSRGYKDVNMLAMQLLSADGILATFSCSGHVDAALLQKILAGAAVDAGRRAQILERLTQSADHPIALDFPEADYLTGVILKVH
jgi:23S rRNA (cytosine1962-C5)-methyltransferase